MSNNKKKGLLKRLSSIDDIKDNFLFTKSLIKNQSKEVKKKYIKEDFESALRRLSIPKENEESHLTSVYYKLKVTFFSYAISSIIILFLSAYQSINSPEVGYLYYAAYLITVALVIKAVECAFRCYQVRIRMLGGLSKFLTSPKEWYPVKYVYRSNI